MELLEARKRTIEEEFSGMNERQFEAVTTTEGPLLVLAGAGSGKTTVLVNRIAYLMKYGNAYRSTEMPYGDGDNFSVNAPRPWEILAITFTNKAANELKERIARKIGDGAEDIWAGTFHSVCGKILRINAEYIGHTSSFTIYDTDDQRRLMKEIMKNLGMDEQLISHKNALAAISAAKDALISPAEYEQTMGADIRRRNIAVLYKEYQKRLKAADAMDFDDMIVKTVELFENNAEVLDRYARRFRYIMVDEYQDTNHAQYRLISLLSGVHNNICVVGDDDQSIYRFRGATIENILNFEDEYVNAKVIRLEQNYRSTGNILAAANAVISHNRGRKGKTLWTDSGDGDELLVYTAADERSEARYIADTILDNIRAGGSLSDHAVLYRNNAQSAAIENAFARSGISYKVIGGHRFFERKEIRDVLAYLHVISNTDDDLRLRRIINEPKRGIGDTTVNHAATIAGELGISLFEVFSRADEFAVLSRASARLKEFCNVMQPIINDADEASPVELLERVLDASGYRTALIAEGTQEAKDRLANVDELVTTVTQYELDNDEPTLAAFLEEIALVSDTDALDSSDDKVLLMTVHSAKGLEFNRVFLIGMEEGLFPSSQSIGGGEAEIEEERRLAYVAITRARKNLVITNAQTRMLYGSTNRNMPSRFLREIPEDYCNCTAEVSPERSYYGGGFGGGFGGGRSTGYAPKFSQSRPSYSSASSQKPFGGFSASAPKKNDTAYTAGMRVEHKAFGEGTVISSKPMGNDVLIEINFDKVGSKKLMSNYANLKIL